MAEPGPSRVPETAIFRSDVCYIRPYKVTDAETVAEEANSPDIAKFMRDGFPSPYTLESAHSWIKLAREQDPILHFVIVKPDGTCVGGIGLIQQTDVESRTYKIGYWIGKNHWGQGIATSAAKGLTEWAFANIPNLWRLEAELYHPNIASGKVLGKVGYKHEGTKKHGAFKRGEPLDVEIFGLTRPDYESLATNS